MHFNFFDNNFGKEFLPVVVKSFWQAIKKYLWLILIFLLIPGIYISQLKFQSKDGTIDFIIIFGLKFISSAINVVPSSIAFNKDPFINSISLFFIVIFP